MLLGKPLVSASALRTDGQLIVLNCPPAPQGSSSGGPCYRCVFPRPPPPESVVGCGEGGILGPVVGVMGVLQALEAIRIIASGQHLPDSLDEEETDGANGAGVQPTLHLFSAGSRPPSLRSVRMRGRRKQCFACGETSTLTLETLAGGLVDYVLFCGGTVAPVDILKPEERISAVQYSRLRDKAKHLLLDVRERENFDIGSIEGAINVPFSRTQSGGSGNGAGEHGELPPWAPPGLEEDVPVYIVCRVGNDSQLVTKMLKDWGLDRNGDRFIGDIRGGIRAWKNEVDSTIPFT